MCHENSIASRRFDEKRGDMGGVFAKRAHSVGTARAQRQSLRCLSREHPCKPPRYRNMSDPFKPASGVQNSGPWDPWLLAVENSRLYAQRGHSARCAPMHKSHQWSTVIESIHAHLA